MLNAFAPPFKIVASYFILAFCYLVAFCGMFFLQNKDISDFAFKALIHCFFAGFALNLIIGALYQLSSVIYEKAFISVKGVFVASILQNLGVFALVFGFLKSDITILLCAAFISAFSLLYFIILFLLSFFDFSHIGKISLFFAVINLFIALVFAVLLCLFFAGFLQIEYEICLKMHIFFMLSFVYFVCIGAARELLPMFSLAHDISDTPLKIAFILQYFGLISRIFVVFSLICFVFWCLLVLKKRARKMIDFWNFNVFISCIFCLVACVFLLLFSYKFALLCLILGILLPFITAHAYKILPFLIWFHFVSKFVGKAKVPLLNDMLNTKIAFAAIYANLAAIFCVFLQPFYANFAYFAWGFLAIFLLLFLINIIKIFGYIFYKGE